MRGTLSFNLPEEKDDFKLATNAGAYSCALLEMGNFLRSLVKYRELTEEQRTIVEEIREKYFQETEGLEFI